MDLQAVSHTLLNHWILLICTSVLAYFIFSAIYNLYFSSLAKYPGPFLARISSLPSFYYSTTGYRHIWIWQCHQIYGSSCRIQPNEVVFNSPSAYRSIYNQAANVRKADIYMVWRRNINSISTLTDIDKSTHGKKKRLLTAAFTDKAIRSAETFISRHVDRFCDLLADGEKDAPKNMSQLSDYLVFDIMCDLSFGKSFDIKEPKPSPLKNITQSFDKYTAFMSNIGRSPFLHLWLWLKSKGLNTLLEHVKPQDMGILFDLIHESVLQRLKEEIHNEEDNEGTRKDMFHFLFHNKDSETGKRAYSNEALAIESGLLLSTALGATATTISALFFYITRNPNVYQKLASEIRISFTSAKEIQSSAALISCRYLRACIDETLRMTPAAPGENMRCVLPGGQEIDGQLLPEGVLVGTSSWSLFHNEEFFSDPWVFRPERWIVDENLGVSAASVADAQEAFFPFGIGPVSCVGQKLARSILSIMVAKTLFRLDVVATPESQVGEGNETLGWGRRNKKVFQVRDATFALRDGPVVQFIAKQTG